MRTYRFKQCRRVSPGAHVGELTKSDEFTARGLSEAERLILPQLRKIDFTTDFAILEGDTGYASCWMTGFEQA